LDAFHADICHCVSPDNANRNEQQAAGLRIGMETIQDKSGGEEGADSEPADLQQAHQ